MINPVSQIESAWRSTLIHLSEGSDFLRNCANHGLDKPEWASVQAWRQAVHAVAYGPKGVYGCIQRFTEHALSDYADTIPVTTSSATPSRMYGAFAQGIEGCWIRYEDDGALYRVDSVDPGGTFADLAPIGTNFWSPADFGDSSGSARLLAFTIKELTYGEAPLYTRSGIALSSSYPYARWWGESYAVEVQIHKNITGATHTYLHRRNEAWSYGPNEAGFITFRSDAPGHGFPAVYVGDENVFPALRKALENIALKAALLSVVERPTT